MPPARREWIGKTLRDWVHRYNESGAEGLKTRWGPGPTPKLTAAQMQELRELVIAGPDPKVHPCGALAFGRFA